MSLNVQIEPARMQRVKMNRASALLAAIVAVLVVAGCAPGLPNTVVTDSTVRIGWQQQFTNLNAASVEGATAGNLDVAALTRGSFFTETSVGLNVTDGFGTVSLTEQDPFTVRYDLAETDWSDGVPVDAADLLLAWAAGSNAVSTDGFDVAAHRSDDGVLDVPEGETWFDSVDSELRNSIEIPEYDEFARRIDVVFNAPVVHWQEALHIAVPAHVLGMQAFDMSDPMAAKLRVMEAVVNENADDLAVIAAEWNTGFRVAPGDDVQSMTSSGPYRITAFNADGIEFAVNSHYRAVITSTYQYVNFVRVPAGEGLAAVTGAVDVMQFAPTDDNFTDLRDLERQGYGQYASNDGRIWAMSLRVDRGVFQSQGARWSFLHGSPREDMVAAGAGEWGTDFASTTSVLFQPGTRGAQMSMEDAGFSAAYAEAGADVAAAERDAAGVPAGTNVCVLYNKGSVYAARAFAALREAQAEAGWSVQDCGTTDMDTGLAASNWDAAITTIPIPETPNEVMAIWGTTAVDSLTGNADPDRDLLIDAYANAGGDDDLYAADEALVQVEASIINAAVVLPLSINPVITVSVPGVSGIAPVSGPVQSLSPGIIGWAPEQE